MGPISTFSKKLFFLPFSFPPNFGFQNSIVFPFFACWSKMILGHLQVLLKEISGYDLILIFRSSVLWPFLGS